MAVPRSQHGYQDVIEEMATVDQLGPLARKAFNTSPRELSARQIVELYQGDHQVDLLDPGQDKAFVKWLAVQYREMAGHSINYVLKRDKKAPDARTGARS